jgi:hypothetical protein
MVEFTDIEFQFCNKYVVYLVNQTLQHGQGTCVNIDYSRPLPKFVKCNAAKEYRGADKSLALPGRKQATATEDFEIHMSYL